MAHNHGYEHQVRVVYENGTEKLSAWTNSEEQIAKAMAAFHTPHVKAYWLRERKVLCLKCVDREQRIMEFPLTDILCPRCSPHDSRYLVAVGVKDPYALPHSVR